MEALGTPSVGSIGGEWMVIGLARSDRNVPGVEDYYKKVLEYVAENIDTETGRLHKAKSTDNSRIILALTAIGRDVTNVGGYDLLQGLSDLDFVKYQGQQRPHLGAAGAGFRQLPRTHRRHRHPSGAH